MRLKLVMKVSANWKTDGGGLEELRRTIKGEPASFENAEVRAARLQLLIVDSGLEYA
jgi:hypothetical protein